VNVFISKSCIHDINDVDEVQALAKVLAKKGHTLLLVDSSELPEGTEASTPIKSADVAPARSIAK
jgi:hypothetical protein